MPVEVFFIGIQELWDKTQFNFFQILILPFRVNLRDLLTRQVTLLGRGKRISIPPATSTLRQAQ
ncbi:MAG: hypothetical protein J0L62_00110 [Bacteroidetes bacterium]|nr:hypothetical protein [Bacteroidota bacterium]